MTATKDRCCVFDAYINGQLVSWCILPAEHDGNHEVSVSSEILDDVVAVVKRLESQTDDLLAHRGTPARRKFVIRTIKNGAVKVNGIIFKPDLDASRFDGTRAAFGLYYIGDRWNSRFIYLWGTEKEFNTLTDTNPVIFKKNGFYVWEWWNRVELGVSRSEVSILA